MKERVKNIFNIKLTILCITTITVSAASLIKSSDVVYDNTKSGLKSATVQGAVDELYSAATDYSSLATRVTALEENKFLDSHPVGSIYITISENENTVTKMHNLYGGTWQRYSEGRTLVGVGTGTDSNGRVVVFNKNESAGEYAHLLTISEMPTHRHVEIFPVAGLTNAGWHEYSENQTDEPALSALYQLSETFTTGQYYPITTRPKGESNYHNNVQPYITVYMYKRVS